MSAHALTPGERERIIIEMSTGKTQRDTARACGVSISTVARVWREHQEEDRAAGGGITRKLNGKIRQRMVELEIGLKRGEVTNEQAVDDAVEFAALDRTRVIARHKDEWDKHRPLVDDAMRLAMPDAEEKRDLKTALQVAEVARKTADTIRTRQEAERKLYGLDVGDGDADSRPYAGMGDDDLQAVLAAEMARLKAEGLIDDHFLERTLQ